MYVDMGKVCRLAAGHKGIFTNGEDAIMPPAAFSNSYQVTFFFRYPQKRSTSPFLDCNGVDGIFYHVKQYKPDMGQIERLFGML